MNNDIDNINKQLAELKAAQEAVGNRVGNVLNIAITLATGRHAADDHLTTENMSVAYWSGYVHEAEAIYDNISKWVDNNTVVKAQEDIKKLNAQIEALLKDREALTQRAKLMGSPKKVITLI